MRSVAGGVAAAALAGGFLLGLAGPAAAAAPSFEPDPASHGSVNFYDAAGHRITSGLITDNPMAAYYGASGGALNAGDTNAYIAYATPQDGVPTLSWTTVETWTAPVAFGAAVVHPGDLAGSANAIAKAGAADGAFNVHTAAFPNASTANPGIYQVRLYTSGTNTTTYYSTDILVSGSSWTQVFPAPAATTTALTASPASPQVTGTNVTLNATVSGGAGGTVSFFDGTTQVGTTQPLSATGTASVTVTSPVVGSHSYTAQYTPVVGSAPSASTSTALAYTINPVAATTTTTAAVDATTAAGNTAAFGPVTVTATVAPNTAPGSVTFTDSVAGSLGSATVTGGTASLTTNALGQGSHTITAAFTSSNSVNFANSSGTTAAFTILAPAVPPANATVDANVAAGSLAISTFYTGGVVAGVDHTFHLGTLQLNSAGTQLSVTTPFGDVAGGHAADAVKVVDTRSGNVQWTASASATDFTGPSGALIDAKGFGFTGVAPVYVAGNAISATNAPAVTDVPAYDYTAPGAQTGLKGAPHQFATITHGDGTVSFAGNLTLNAPTSTKAGLYTTTLTFTVI